MRNGVAGQRAEFTWMQFLGDQEEMGTSAETPFPPIQMLLL